MAGNSKLQNIGSRTATQMSYLWRKWRVPGRKVTQVSHRVGGLMSNKKKKKKEKKGEKALMERWKPVEAWSRAPNHLATPLPPKHFTANHELHKSGPMPGLLTAASLYIAW